MVKNISPLSMRILMKYLTIFIFISLSNTMLLAATFATRGGIIVDSPKFTKHSNWRTLASTEKDSVREVVRIIETSTLGVKLIARARLKARRENLSLLDVISSGNVSVTDTTLIRRFSPESPEKVSYEAKSKVVIDKGLSVKNAVLDLAHELTHYVFKTPFNPYKKNFDITQFMIDTIEGRGGEIDAFVVECKIGREIFGPQSPSSQCGEIVDSSGEFSKVEAQKEFYKLGAHYLKFMSLSKKHQLQIYEVGDISEGTSSLISSAWGQPYPLAVFSEYESIMGRVCQNDKRRLSYFKTFKRSPASRVEQYNTEKEEILARCKQFL